MARTGGGMARAVVAQVLGWSPGVAGSASATVVEADSAFSGAIGRVGRVIDAAVGGWQGEAGAAAALRAVESQVAASHIGAALVEVAEALAAAAALERVCELVRQIEGRRGPTGAGSARTGRSRRRGRIRGTRCWTWCFRPGSMPRRRNWRRGWEPCWMPRGDR